MFFKKALAMMLAGSMLLTSASFAAAEASPQYTVETTKDGWIKVTQQDGPALGYDPESGVTLLEVDGYAFKDLNKNGVLDVYEDWRLTAEERAASAVSMMSLAEQSAMRVNPGIMSVDLENDIPLTIGLEAEAGTVEGYITNDGVRYILAYPYFFSDGSNAKDLAAWANKEQAVAESAGLGLPVIINCDENFNLMNNMTLMGTGATFDVAATTRLYNNLSILYRAMGVTMMLGPQADLQTEPRVNTTQTFTEDPQLGREMINAAINGLQSTFDEDGNDLGWGSQSVMTQMKHFAANESTEGGRSYHAADGKYLVFPGDAFETQLVPYVEGGFDLTGETKQTTSVMITYTIPWDEYGDLGDNHAGAVNEDLCAMARDNGFVGFISTDNLSDQAIADCDGSITALSPAEQVALMFTSGVDQIMGYRWSLEDMLAAYDLMVADMGEEAAAANYSAAAYRCVLPMFYLGIVENAYVSPAEAVRLMKSGTYDNTAVTDIAQEGIVMLKNDGSIKAFGETQETVYIPFIPSGDSWAMPFSERAANQNFNYVTDTLDADGSLVRASAEELAGVTKALVVINRPASYNGIRGGSVDDIRPISLQYAEYVADGDNVREKSIAGDQVKVTGETMYGAVVSTEQEDRSYYGMSTVALNLAEKDAFVELATSLPEDISVVLCVRGSGAMIYSEIEPYADAILMMFNTSDLMLFTGMTNDNFLAVAAGKVEPTGLLPIQMPADMDTVEAQYEDVPRDATCYVDANGNTYDFAYGLNWSGLIEDARTEQYRVPAQVGLR